MADELAARAASCFASGLHLTQEGKYEEALSSFAKASALEPSNVAFHKARADTYYALADFKSALWYYHQMLEVTSGDKEVCDLVSWLLDMQGQSCLEKGGNGAAAMFFDEAIARSPTEPVFWMHRTLANIRACAWEKANHDLDRWIIVDHENPVPYIIRAKLAWFYHQQNRGNADMEKARRLCPTHPEVESYHTAAAEHFTKLKREAAQMMLSGEFERAAQLYTEALDSHAFDLKIYISRASAYRQQGLFEEALADIDHASQMSKGPNQPREDLDITKQRNLIINDLSLVHLQAGRYAKALELLSVVIESEEALADHNQILGVSAEFYINRGDCRKGMGKLQEALEDYKKAMSLAVNDKDHIMKRCALVHHTLGIEEFNKGNFSAASLELTRAIEYAPNVSVFYEERGNANYFAENFQDAVQDYTRALKLDPCNHTLKAKLHQFSSLAALQNLEHLPLSKSVDNLTINSPLSLQTRSSPNSIDKRRMAGLKKPTFLPSSARHSSPNGRKAAKSRTNNDNHPPPIKWHKEHSIDHNHQTGDCLPPVRKGQQT